MKVPKRAAVAPPTWDRYDALALKALAAGNASESQQKRALEFIVRDVASTYDLSYRPGHADETVFAEGKRFVGLQIVKLVNLPAELLPKPTD